MKTSMIKMLSLAICLVVCLCLIPSASAAGGIVHSGAFGDISWTLDAQGLLVISGEGWMSFPSSEDDSAWRPYKDEIKRVIINPGVVNIDYRAFAYCRNLIDVQIPDSVAGMASYAFYNCSSLQRLIFPGAIESFPEGAFGYCTSLKSIGIPDTVTYFGRGTFEGCDALTDVYYRGTEEQWDYQAFNYSWNAPLRDATIHFGSKYGVWGDLRWILDENGLLTITGNGNMNDIKGRNDAWLEYKNEISALVIDEGITRIGQYAFRDCGGLLSVSIPNSMAAIGHHAFLGCDNMNSVYISSIESWCGIDFGEDGYGNPLFYAHNLYLNDTLVQNLTLPSDISTIRVGAFSGCSLKNVVIPEGVSSIGGYAFNECKNLEKINIPGSVKSIGEFSFGECISIQSIIIPGSLAVIDRYAFAGCSGLTDLTIQEGVSEIGYRAFRYCESLSTVALPDSVVKIDNEAFGQCVSLSEILLNDGLEEIGYDVFRGCTSLKSVEIPDSVKSIGNGAFQECINLKSVKLPESLTYLWSMMFYNCSSLTDVVIPEGLTNISTYAFDGCTSLADIDLPDTLESIGESAFNRCSSLKSIKVPDLVSVIDYGLFKACSSLESISLPAGITTINDNAFDGCVSLTDVYFDGSVDQWREIAIGSNNTQLENVRIHYNEEPLDGLNGYCGNHVRWHIDDEGVLTIFGNGEMYDFTYNNAPSYAQYCSLITEICISYGVTYVGNYSFYSNSGFYYISDLTIADSVIGIGEYAFFGCSSSSLLIAVSDALSSVGKNAFPDGDSTSSSYGTIRSTVLLCSDDSYIASEESGYADWCLTESLCHGKAGRNIYYDFDPESRTLSFSGQGNLYESDFYFRGAYITQNIIFDSTMETTTFPRLPGFTQVKEITIPNGVLALPDFAFSAFRSLETVVMPNSITTIGAYAFDSCSKLSQITFSESLKRIEDNAFRKCGLLSHIAIPTSVEYIGAYSFLECKNLIHVKVIQYDDNIVSTQCSIKDSAFQDCENLVNVDFLEAFTNLSLANRVFYGCKNLEDMNIVAQNLKVGLETFYSLQQLKTVEIHANHVEIKDSAFAHCDNLEKVCFTCGNDDSSFISDMAFDYSDEVVLYGYECSYVKEYAERNGIPFVSYGHVISLVEARMPTIDEDGYYQYWKCDLCEKKFSDEKGENEIQSPVIIPAFGKADFVLPSNLTIIEPEAFYGLSMCVVSCPDSLQEIQSKAFCDCRNLRAIYIPETTVVISDDAFGENSSLVIWGEPDSYAQEYAENRFLFVAFPRD